MADLRSPALYHINTRVWLTELSHKLGRLAPLEDIPDADKEGPNGEAIHAHQPGMAASRVSR
jgi:hypothetical protein